MRYLHTMVRVRDIEDSKRFYCDGLGLRETRRHENEGGRFTLVFLAPEGQEECPIELTYNWDPEDYQAGAISAIWPMKPPTSTPCVST